jgi:hypothetical protein
MSNPEWLRPFGNTESSSATVKPIAREQQQPPPDGIEGMDNDEATLERERARLQQALQLLDLRVVIESVQRAATHDNFVLSPEAYAVRQRILDVVLVRENQLQYSLREVRVQRERPGWSKVQLPWTSALAIQRLPLKRTRYPLPLFVLGKLALGLLELYLLYFLYRLHAVK